MFYLFDLIEIWGSGLILVFSFVVKKVYGIINISCVRDLFFFYLSDLYIVVLRMVYYMEKNREINIIYKKYVDEVNYYVYFVDESFFDVINSMVFFGKMNVYDMVKLIYKDVFEQIGIYMIIGIGDNLLFVKLVLDNGLKDGK